ncbi:hypothetical protein ABBQ38_008413 [Trebouxia sp. C0009 RCD-2024]
MDRGADTQMGNAAAPQPILFGTVGQVGGPSQQPPLATGPAPAQAPGEREEGERSSSPDPRARGQGRSSDQSLLLRNLAAAVRATDEGKEVAASRNPAKKQRRDSASKGVKGAHDEPRVAKEEWQNRVKAGKCAGCGLTGHVFRTREGTRVCPNKKNPAQHNSIARAVPLNGSQN